MTVTVLQHRHEFVDRHSSHPLNVVHLQLQQYNEALVNTLTHMFKKTNALTASKVTQKLLSIEQSTNSD